MSRLYDRFQRQGFDSVPYNNLANLLPEATVVEGSNVSAYYSEHIVDNEESRLTLGDNPTGLLSPFSNCWLEWRPQVYGEETPPYFALGWHLVTADVAHLSEDMLDGWVKLLQTHGYENFVDQARWACTATLFGEVRKGVVIPPFLSMFYALDFDGDILNSKHNPEPGFSVVVNQPYARDEAEANELLYAFACEWQTANLCLAFMHCKNVELYPNEPPTKLSKKHRRKSGHGLTKYYTLTIEPLKASLRKASGGERISTERALHICRGHFATYSDEKPLFGKYSGTYWKPQHVRGSKESGEVIKDYAVKAPKGGS